MPKFLENGIRFFKHQFARGALILIYHRITESRLDPWSLSVSPDHFAEHLAVLRRSFHPKSLQELGRSIHGRSNIVDRSIVITFDDGYADNLHAALPLLEKFDVPATIFLASGAIGSQHEFWWDELTSLLLSEQTLPDRLALTIRGKSYSWEVGEAAQVGRAADLSARNWKVGQPAPSSRYSLYLALWQLIHGLSSEEQKVAMTAIRAWAGNSSYTPIHRIMDENEVAKLAQSQQIEIGAHTISHVSLAPLSCDSQRDEIQGSKAQLEKMINRPVQSFSYPFGKRSDYQSQTISLVQEAGFSVACSNEPGVVGAETDPFQLPRIHIHDCGGDEFEARLISKFHVRN